ncbi:Glycosyl transferases group 1 [compost metagenome]
MFYKYDIYKYNKLVDVFFLPSFEMAEYIPNLKVPKIEELPPGLEFEHRSLNIHSKSSTEKLNILYVGGLSKDIYDIELFVKVVSQYIEFKLTICCREYDLRNLDPAVLDCFNNTRNVEIVHMHGEDLQYLYYNSDICCLFIKPIDYWNFAMPAKMFEYLSFLKPIIAVDNTVAGRFVKDNGWGWSIPYTNENLSSLLVEIKNNPSILERFRNYLVEGRENNTWKRRAETIVDKLCNKV